jgi:hypothetical protein
MYKFILPSQLPPLRMLLVWDNLAGHQTNATNSDASGTQGQHPHTPGQIIEWLETIAEVWNQHSTPFEWGGKRFARRQRARLRSQQHRLSSSGACTRLPLPRTALK